MRDLRLIVHAQMRAQVGRFGCLDATASMIRASTGGECSIGTLSKRLAGHLSWPIEDVAALEEALGEYPITEMLARRLRGNDAPSGLPLTTHAGAIAKETGEAIAAAISACASDRAEDYATAVVELDEAAAAISVALRVVRMKMIAADDPLRRGVDA